MALADLKVLRLISGAGQISRNISFTCDNTCKQFAVIEILTNLCFDLLGAIHDMKFKRLKMGAMKANRFIRVGKSRGQREKELSKHLETTQKTNIFFFHNFDKAI